VNVEQESAGDQEAINQIVDRVADQVEVRQVAARLAAAIGVMTLAAALLLPLLGYRKLFLVAFLPGILAVGAILPVKDAPAPEEKGEKQRISILRLPGALKLFLLIAGLFSLGHFGYAFLLLKAKGIGLADTSALWLYILYYVVYSLCSTPRPALMRCTSPGTIAEPFPMLSLWASAPSST